VGQKQRRRAFYPRELCRDRVARGGEIYRFIAVLCVIHISAPLKNISRIFYYEQSAKNEKRRLSHAVKTSRKRKKSRENSTRVGVSALFCRNLLYFNRKMRNIRHQFFKE
jgi:hypothetical protein